MEGNSFPCASSDGQPTQQPVAVEAVLGIASYPSDLVDFVYQQLTTGSLPEVTQTGKDAGAGTEVGHVTAAMLMRTIDDILAGRLSAGGHHAKVPSLASLPAGAAAMMAAGPQATTDDLQQDGVNEEEEKQPSSRPTHPSRDHQGPQLHPDPSGHSPAGGTATTTASPLQAAATATAASSGTHTHEAGIASQVATTSSPAKANSVEAAAATQTGAGAVSSAVPASSPALPVCGDSSETQPATEIYTSARTTPVDRPETARPRDTTRADVDKAGKKRLQLERLRALRAENRRLKARQTCRQCRQQPVALTFLPCGHFTFCQECGSKFDACPVCRKTILADVRTFMS